MTERRYTRLFCLFFISSVHLLRQDNCYYKTWTPQCVKLPWKRIQERPTHCSGSPTFINIADMFLYLKSERNENIFLSLSKPDACSSRNRYDSKKGFLIFYLFDSVMYILGTYLFYLCNMQWISLQREYKHWLIKGEKFRRIYL